MKDRVTLTSSLFVNSTQASSPSSAAPQLNQAARRTSGGLFANTHMGSPEP
jgi:hypothetical protein